MFDFISFDFQFVKVQLQIAIACICFTHMSFLQFYIQKLKECKNIILMIVGKTISCDSCLAFWLGLILTSNFYYASFSWIITFLISIYLNRIKY